MRRQAHRSIVLAASAALLTVAALTCAGGAAADTVGADGDLVTPAIESTVVLPPVAPGATISLQVGFELSCSGFSHVDAGQSIVLEPGSSQVPSGADVTFTGATIDAPPAGWPEDGADCSGSPGPVAATGVSEVTLTAPMAPGAGYLYTLMWTRRLMPAGADVGTFRGPTAVTFSLDVVDNTPPILQLPSDATVEGNAAGGAIAAYSVTATDEEDATPPLATCSPAAGARLPLGATTVTCAATDTDGATTTGSFTITVVDTTPPALANVPGPLTLATTDPTGAALAYPLPTATDAVDAAPAVACWRMPGTTVPVGTTTVTCTASDASGNTASASFPVTVRLWSAAWDSPIASPSASVTANWGRMLPVKVRISVDGVAVTRGSTLLRVSRCDGSGSAVATAVAWDGESRWKGLLDTSRLAGPGCHRADLVVDGVVAGSFRLDVVGSSTSTSQVKGPTATRR